MFSTSAAEKKPHLPAVAVFFLVLLAGASFALFPASSVRAAAAVPPGFLPDLGKNDMTWAQGDAFCKSRKGALPTEAQLKAIARGGAGDGSFVEFELADGYYWSRDGMDKQRITVSLADGLSAPASSGSRRPVICGYGAARPRKAEGVPAGFATPMALTALFWTDADRFCKRQGKQLPDVNALKAIAGRAGNGSYAKHGWPPSLFWTREGSSGRRTGVSLGDGSTMSFRDTDKHWTVCVD